MVPPGPGAAGEPAQPAQPAATATPHRPHLGFAKRNHLARSFGLLLGLLGVATALHVQGAPGWMWIPPMLHCLLWPHLAWWLARRADDPRQAEHRNLLVDHACGGAWTALMCFSVVPGAAALGLMSMNTMAGGGPRLLRHGLLAHAAGLLAGVLVFGLRWQPATDLLTTLACVPMLLLQPIAIGHTASLALRKLNHKHTELERQSRQDGLSGLYNRSHWEALVEAEFKRCRRSGQAATLVLTDLDHFKHINDAYGHAAGDAVIRRFAELLKSGLRLADVPGRYGGEEFGILLPGTAIAEAREVVERLREQLHQAPLMDGVVVTASFGAVELSAEIEHGNAWVRMADQMLYRAKHLGRDRLAMPGEPVPFDPATLTGQPPAASGLAAPGGYSAALSQLLRGLGGLGTPMALFDPSDRLGLATPSFMALYAVQPQAMAFGDIMRHCHAQRIGPRIETLDIAAWLRAADNKRRSVPQRSFDVDMWDGRWFRVTETSYSDGWLVLVMNERVAPSPAGSQGSAGSDRTLLS
ncbi:MAG TPA: diguanylate cyclase [Ideonella sp.]|nr:diguanylate cyclase [Ideonella sp.]